MNQQSKTLFAKNLLPRFWKYLDEPKEFEEDLKLYQSIFLAGGSLQNTVLTEVLDFCLRQAEFVQNTADIVLAVKHYCKLELLPLRLGQEFQLYLVKCYIEGDSRITQLFERL